MVDFNGAVIDLIKQNGCRMVKGTMIYVLVR